MYYQTFQVQLEVKSELNFVDVNVDLKLSPLKLIYGTWLVEISKEINRALLKNAKLIKSDSKYKIVKKREIPWSRNMSAKV